MTKGKDLQISFKENNLLPSEYIERRGINEIILAPENEIMFARDYTIGHLKPVDDIVKIFGKFFLVANLEITPEELHFLALELIESYPDLKISDVILIARKGASGSLAKVSWGSFRWQDILAPKGWVQKYIEYKDEKRILNRNNNEKQVQQIDEKAHHIRRMKYLAEQKSIDKKSSEISVKTYNREKLLVKLHSDYSELMADLSKHIGNPLALSGKEYVIYRDNIIYSMAVNKENELLNNAIKQIINDL